MITTSILTSHLSQDQSCRGKLAELNEKVTSLERQLEYLEASINGAANQIAAVNAADASG